MIEEFAYNFVFEKVKAVFERNGKENEFFKYVGGIARKAKRLAVYIMSEGILKGLLFAYSKAKVYNIKKFDDVLDDKVKKLETETEWKEADDWLVVSRFVIEFIIKKFGNILNIKNAQKMCPEDVLKRLINAKDKLRFVEDRIVNALDSLSMLCFALEKR